MELNIKENTSASLSYILLLRRDKMNTRANVFKKNVKLTELKLSLTNKLISLNKPQIQHMGFEELRALSRQQIFSKKLETAIAQLYSRKKARAEEKKHILEKPFSERLAKQQGKSDEQRTVVEGNDSAKVCTTRTDMVERMCEWMKSSPEERRRILAKQRRERLAKQQISAGEVVKEI